MNVIEGGCYCGAIRYRLNGSIVGTAACHCRKCQYGSGGAANHSALVAREAFELLTAHRWRSVEGRQRSECNPRFLGRLRHAAVFRYADLAAQGDPRRQPRRPSRVGAGRAHLDGSGARVASDRTGAVRFAQGPGSRRL